MIVVLVIVLIASVYIYNNISFDFISRENKFDIWYFIGLVIYLIDIRWMI